MTRPSTLRDELRRQVEAEEREILARAAREEESILSEARRRAEERAGQAWEKDEADLRARRKGAVAKAHQEGRNVLRSLQKEELDATFALAAERLRDLPRRHPEEWDFFLQRLFQACRERLPGEGVRIRLGPAVQGLFGPLREEGVRWVVEEGLDGLVLESADGRQRCEATPQVLLQNLRRLREPQIEAILFSEPGDDGSG